MQLSSQATYEGRDWASLASDYAANALTVREISALYAISRTALYNHASREGWPMRAGIAGSPKRRRLKCAEFGQRLIGALDRKIADFEARRDDAVSAADAERDARTLNTLVRLTDKLRGMAGKSAGPSARATPAASLGPAAFAAKDTHDPDGLRRDLARRLETLRLSLDD